MQTVSTTPAECLLLRLLLTEKLENAYRWRIEQYEGYTSLYVYQNIPFSNGLTGALLNDD